MSNFTADQWPDKIRSGEICYGKAHNYDGFYLADASHGIPTFGSVADSAPATIRGQHVKVFNYPGQTEAIAAQLVQRWNCHPALLAALEAIDAYWTADFPEGPDGSRVALGGLGQVSDDTMNVWRKVREALALAA